ncbi:hypothetical protein T492DRAFT_1002236 [Pavlovales sp. CCMP2436]|nr:hypothetical protein T492DRAFT_1002236 [Pavlovales sp. CCMP2436]
MPEGKMWSGAGTERARSVTARGRMADRLHAPTSRLGAGSRSPSPAQTLPGRHGEDGSLSPAPVKSSASAARLMPFSAGPGSGNATQRPLRASEPLPDGMTRVVMHRGLRNGNGGLGMRMERELAGSAHDLLVLAEVTPGMVADKHGLKAGDQIMTINGKSYVDAVVAVQALRESFGEIELMLSRQKRQAQPSRALPLSMSTVADRLSGSARAGGLNHLVLPLEPLTPSSRYTLGCALYFFPVLGLGQLGGPGGACSISRGTGPYFQHLPEPVMGGRLRARRRLHRSCNSR